MKDKGNTEFEVLQNQEQVLSATSVVSNQRNYGRYFLFCMNQYGQPRYMLGPHCWLFFLALFFSIGLLYFLLSSLKSVLSQAWYWILVVTSALFVLSYLNVGFSRPGIASRAQDGTVEEKQERQYCVPCRIVRGRGTYHCQDCNVCIAGYDHHCPWVGKCVGKDNLSAFYMFLIMTFGTLIMCFIATICSNGSNGTNNLITTNKVFT